MAGTNVVPAFDADGDADEDDGNDDGEGEGHGFGIASALLLPCVQRVAAPILPASERASRFSVPLS
jgi:hypothetical protein